MAEQPVNLSTVPYLGVFSRAEQRVLQVIFKAIAEGGGRCVASLATLARESNTSKSTTRNAIARAVAIGLLENTERRSYCAVSLPNILTYAEAMMVPHTKATHDLQLREVA
jgi:Helix-turn-helix domain